MIDRFSLLFTLMLMFVFLNEESRAQDFCAFPEAKSSFRLQQQIATLEEQLSNFEISREKLTDLIDRSRMTNQGTNLDYWISLSDFLYPSGKNRIYLKKLSTKIIFQTYDSWLNFYVSNRLPGYTAIVPQDFKDRFNILLNDYFLKTGGEPKFLVENIKSLKQRLLVQLESDLVALFKDNQLRLSCPTNGVVKYERGNSQGSHVVYISISNKVNDKNSSTRVVPIYPSRLIQFNSLVDALGETKGFGFSCYENGLVIKQYYLETRRDEYSSGELFIRLVHKGEKNSMDIYTHFKESPTKAVNNLNDTDIDRCL